MILPNNADRWDEENQTSFTAFPQCWKDLPPKVQRMEPENDLILLLNQKESPNIQWFSGKAAVTLHVVPDSHPLDDEPNLYEWGMIRNRHFHPFKKIVVYLEDHPI